MAIFILPKLAACAAVAILTIQTILNVFGTMDLLPLTGVTFPFLSNGGSSMMSAWGLLAFIKAADTRQNASFAIRLTSQKELRAEAEAETFDEGSYDNAYDDGYGGAYDDGYDDAYDGYDAYGDPEGGRGYE